MSKILEPMWINVEKHLEKHPEQSSHKNIFYLAAYEFTAFMLENFIPDNITAEQKEALTILTIEIGEFAISQGNLLYKTEGGIQ